MKNTPKTLNFCKKNNAIFKSESLKNNAVFQETLYYIIYLECDILSSFWVSLTFFFLPWKMGVNYP